LIHLNTKLLNIFKNRRQFITYKRKCKLKNEKWELGMKNEKWELGMKNEKCCKSAYGGKNEK